jgi:DNA-binding IclR family transcriptional regulator
MERNTGSPTLIASVRRALRLLEAVADHPNGAPAKQLARETGMPLATTYHLLRTLLYDGYLRRLDEGVYLLGDRIDGLGRIGGHQMLISRIRPALTAIRDDLRAASYLTLYSEGEIQIVDIADGPHTPRVDLWVGFNDACHATAIGKCVIGQLNADERADYVDRHPLVGLTPNTATRAGELMRRISASQPYVWDREEFAIGTTCVAVPITGPGFHGSLGVSWPNRRTSEISDRVEMLRTAAVRVSRTVAITRS